MKENKENPKMRQCKNLPHTELKLLDQKAAATFAQAHGVGSSTTEASFYSYCNYKSSVSTLRSDWGESAFNPTHQVKSWLLFQVVLFLGVYTLLQTRHCNDTRICTQDSHLFLDGRRDPS